MPDFLQEVSAEFSSTPLFIGADAFDRNLEAQNNTHSFSITSTQAKSLTVDDLRQMLYRIIGAKREQLHQQRGTSYPMQFYCWHDELAAQLRFSLIAAAAVLPFGCRLLLIADIAEIIQPFLDSDYLDGVSWDELEAIQDNSGPDSEAVEFCLRVWRTRL